MVIIGSGELCTESGEVTFDVSKGQMHGSLLLQKLLELKHNKTVVNSLKSLSESTIMKLAAEKNGSFMLQKAFRSTTVEQADKVTIAKPLKVGVVNVNLIGNLTIFLLVSETHKYDVLWFE